MQHLGLFLNQCGIPIYRIAAGVCNQMEDRARIITGINHTNGAYADRVRCGLKNGYQLWVAAFVVTERTADVQQF